MRWVNSSTRASKWLAKGRTLDRPKLRPRDSNGLRREYWPGTRGPGRGGRSGSATWPLRALNSLLDQAPEIVQVRKVVWIGSSERCQRCPGPSGPSKTNGISTRQASRPREGIKAVTAAAGASFVGVRTVSWNPDLFMAVELTFGKEGVTWHRPTGI